MKRSLFNMFKATRRPCEFDNCFRVDIMERRVTESSKCKHLADLLMVVMFLLSWFDMGNPKIEAHRRSTSMSLNSKLHKLKPYEGMMTYHEKENKNSLKNQIEVDQHRLKTSIYLDNPD
ncbi:LOW QUALITY PROTEIN: hypothetical protein TorRG33x02_305560 [Trema orientale]|uniref:Uncharacterized protein n=1 Tax=Trema orientale TaxID=63057 RepID=A0A2P5BXB1_TREOI|nr:LOW QUALITY PROTEIN: hypothetical protein TorRG33x02_305560 [Trema orientale]